jgi:RNA polymerase sigma-70 factor, ECF subfamily
MAGATPGRTRVRDVPRVDAVPAGRALPPDAVVVARLRAGDETMFAALLDAWSPGMLRAARAYVADEHTAEDVVEETWLAVLRGIDRFEGRSSLRTWTYRILVNTARTRGAREARTVPMSSLGPIDEDHGLTVDPARFRGADDAYPGHWKTQPAAWPSPESVTIAKEIRAHLADALARLPSRQRVVVVLRDVHGYTAEEICAILDITPVGAAPRRRPGRPPPARSR